MQKIVILLIIVCWACNTSTKVAKNLKKFEKEISWPGLQDSIGNSTFYLSIDNRYNNLYYSVSTSKDTSLIGWLSVDYKGVLLGITSWESARTELYFDYPNINAKYICFSTNMTLDTIGSRKIGRIEWEGYSFRFDKRNRLVAIYLCDDNIILKDIFVADDKYKLTGNKLILREQKATKREKRTLRKKE